MNRKVRELKAQAAQLKNEARTLAETDLVAAKVKVAEAKEILDKAELIEDLDDTETPPAEPIDAKKPDVNAQYNKAFYNAFRGKKMTAADKEAIEAYNVATGMSEDSDANGKLLLPQDLQTQINEYKRALFDLSPLCDVTPVATLTGSRVFETIASMTAFANITDDTADIGEEIPPKFEALTYAIKKYAGWIPVPNDLMNDSDQNIGAYLAKWIARKSVFTRNAHILAVLTALTPVTFADYKGIKKAINITLDPMLSAGAIILTNQDGFQYLDTLEDGNGKPILQVDVTQPTQKLFDGKPIKVVSNSVLATTGTTTKLAPMFVGTISELVKVFERQGYQIASTNVGGTAFRKDRTELRVIQREDVKASDTAAVVYGKIDVTSVI